MTIEDKIASLLAESQKLQSMDEASEVTDADDIVQENTDESSALAASIQEDVNALIEGEDLTEEFKTKAAVIFESAVVTRVKGEVARLEEEFDTRLEEEVESMTEGLIEKVDGYLNYMVEQWINDNELALENGLKNEILESFVTGMKGLFEQHYIDIPEDKYDVLGEMQSKLDTVGSKLDEQFEANVALTKEISELHRSIIVAEATENMADTDAEKFAALTEELAFENVDVFRGKLQIIKENYFGKKSVAITESVVTNEPIELNEDAAPVDKTMARYLRAFNGVK